MTKVKKTTTPVDIASGEVNIWQLLDHLVQGVNEIPASPKPGWSAATDYYSQRNDWITHTEALIKELLDSSYERGYNDCLIEHGAVNLKITKKGES